MFWKRYAHRLDLQAKITLVLLAVILPTHILVTLLESQLTAPVLEQEMLQLGLNTAKNLASQIESAHTLQNEKASALLEAQLQELLYLQPSIQQIDIFKKSDNGGLILLASNVEYESPADRGGQLGPVDSVITNYKIEENGVAIWEILAPIRHHSRSGLSGPVLGMIHMEMSLKTVTTISRAFWKITVVAALVNLVLLMLALNYFLRRTLNNDRLLHQAESQNIELSTQLREAERQLMLNEKLAVMGQLTASFAHEIGTPLNAVSGHLQLLQEDFKEEAKKSWVERIDIISGQLLKIEQIVKNFLQSTAKPPSQNQLIDLNQMLDRVAGIVRPRIDSLHVGLKMNLEKGLGPIRAVPLDIEQIFLNLLNNSLDSIQSKQRKEGKANFQLQLESKHKKSGVKEWAEISVYDTGEGIEKINLKQVFKPFFTTKRIGEGTGLGLTICQQIAEKYHGTLLIESKEGSWTKVTLQIPYRVKI